MERRPISLLCVDENPGDLARLRDELAGVSCDLRAAYCDSATHALSIISKRPPDVVISELTMEEMYGVEFFRKIQAERPEILCIALTGSTSFESVIAAMNEAGAFRYLVKPAELRGLEEALASAIAEVNLRRLRAVSLMSHSAIEGMRNGVLFLNDAYKPLFCNSVAQKLLDARTALKLDRHGALAPGSHEKKIEFYHFLKSLRDTGPDDARSIFRIDARGDAGAIAVSAAYHQETAAEGPCYSLILADPAEARTSEQSVAASLGILPSEAKVVHVIAEGGTLSDAAEVCGISLHSARTYLRNVYSKTGVTRQSELVRIVMLAAV